MRPHEARVEPEVLIPIPNADPKWKPGDKAPAPQPSPWEGKRWPVVKYQNGTIVMMVPFAFKHENADGGVEASRMQVCFRITGCEWTVLKILTG